MRHAPEIIEVDDARLEDVLRRVEQSLDEKDAALIRAVFESYAYVSDLVEDKNTTIRRLRQLFFGARTEKTEAVVGRHSEEPVETPEPGAEVNPALSEGEPNTDQGQRISMLLKGQDFREEGCVHHAPHHLAAETVFDRMTLQECHGEAPQPAQVVAECALTGATTAPSALAAMTAPAAVHIFARRAISAPCPAPATPSVALT
jgi:hypothetical protein